MTSPAVDTTSFHTCPRCGGHDIDDNGDGGEYFSCNTCKHSESASTTNVDDEESHQIRERWRNHHRIRPTVAELNARIDRTNAKFEETEKAKTWPLEPYEPTSRRNRQAKAARRHQRNAADGTPAKGYPENDDLLAAVLAQPDDDEPRLAYAAWQRAQNYDYASTRSLSIAWFIEAQIAAAVALRADPRADVAPIYTRPSGHLHPPAEMRGGIVPNYGDFDLDVLRAEGLIDHLMFFRGLIEHVAVKAHRFLEIADELFALAPIRHLTITYAKGLGHDDPGILRALAASPHLARIRSIELPARMVNNHHTRLNALTDDDLAILAASPHLGQLAYLDLEDAVDVTATGLAHLARSPHLPALSFVGLDLHRYFRELGDYGKHRHELLERRIDALVPALRGQGLERPWFDPVAHYGTPRPDREAVVEHPIALRTAP